MAVKSIRTLMGEMKESFDKSKDRSGWKVLQGMNRGYYDAFLSGDNHLWQIKSEEVGQGEMMAVGTKISRSDEDIEKIMRTGSPVPFGTMTPMNRKLSIIMAGIQTYSSESSSLLCREYLSGSQASLEQKLKSQVDKMMDDPAFRKRYREHKDRVTRAYL
ncbi:MAG: hypothetical protein FIB08_12100 [Candidatus Methanoperedens sp.]|nr:hypothetical protein [Candidatus Methanoperedens sp.]